MTMVDHRTADVAPAYVVPDRVVTTFTANVVETRGLLARIAVQLNPYDVRELMLCLDMTVFASHSQPDSGVRRATKHTFPASV